MTRFSFHSFVNRSRNSTSSGMSKVVSMNTHGNGTCPKNALRASHIMVCESLPTLHSIASQSILLNASRMMKMLWFSNLSRWSIFENSRATPSDVRGEGVESALFLLGTGPAAGTLAFSVFHGACAAVRRATDARVALVVEWIVV